MLASYVGEDRFLKGVSIYLKKHMYKNSVTKDLWEGIQTATGELHRPSHHTPLYGHIRPRHSEDDGQLGQAGKAGFATLTDA